MNFKPNPLLLGANGDFYSTFKLVITMKEPVDCRALSCAVNKGIKRYPYFSVCPTFAGEELVLEQNALPLPVFDSDKAVMLGSDESNGHLISFGCEGKRIILNASHFLCDGMGIDAFLKTVLYLYLCEKHGCDKVCAQGIVLPDSEISSEEYEYPFPSSPYEIAPFGFLKNEEKSVYKLDSGKFDDKGLYAYHLHIPQREMMQKANPSDGSPVSYLSVMLYRAFCALDAALENDVVVHVQHQYRHTLKKMKNKHSLVNYIPVCFPKRAKCLGVETQNTIVRGQIIIGSEPERDFLSINNMLSAIENANSICEKRSKMADYIKKSVEKKTCGISYVGKMDWCGLDKYIDDIYAYIGEKNTKNMLLVEIMTIGNIFSVNFMQGGKGRYYLDAFVKELASFDIPVSLVSEERYSLCDTSI